MLPMRDPDRREDVSYMCRICGTDDPVHHSYHPPQIEALVAEIDAISQRLAIAEEWIRSKGPDGTVVPTV